MIRRAGVAKPAVLLLSPDASAAGSEAVRAVRSFDCAAATRLPDRSRRTALCPHDGRYGTLEETLREGNRGDCLGRGAHLAPSGMKDLIAFLRSL